MRTGRLVSRGWTRAAEIAIAVLAVASWAIAASAEEGADGAPSWPRAYAGADGAAIYVYPPQIERWEEFQRLYARVAVVVQENESAAPAPGAFEVAADTVVDHAERKVALTDVEIVSGGFPAVDEATAERLTARFREILPTNEIIVELDRLVAQVERAPAAEGPVQLRAEPPRIFVSRNPAILVLLDGEPVTAPIEGTDLWYVINTNWDMLHDSDRLYLRDGDGWLRARRLDGPWEAADNLPVGFSRLPDDGNWAEARAAVPGRDYLPGEVAEVYASTEPAELIVIDGSPELVGVEGTRLQEVVNTDSDLFLCQTDGNYYYLISGRWFRAMTLNGPWTFATDDLPADFSRIPADHPRAHVLASVPGTQEAEESLIVSAIPHRADVSRSDPAPMVIYVGAPQFEPIEGTGLEWAVNTSSDVVKSGREYYLCDNAIWYVSISPKGAWQLADALPEEIALLPPSHPLYHVRYVEVADSTSDTVTYVYRSGYWGIYPWRGVVVYGTGWRYRPCVIRARPYPFYAPYAVTYGCGAYYNRLTGTYWRGARARVYGPYGGAARGAAWNPATRTYVRGGAAWGAGGGGGATEAYRPRTGTSIKTLTARDSYTGRTVAAARRTGPGGTTQDAFLGRTPTGDLYAGRDGNVYRRSGDGWQKHGSGGWNTVTPPPRAMTRRAPVERGTTPTSRVGDMRDRDLSLDRADPPSTTRDRVGRPGTTAAAVIGGAAATGAYTGPTVPPDGGRVGDMRNRDLSFDRYAPPATGRVPVEPYGYLHRQRQTRDFGAERVRASTRIQSAPARKPTTRPATVTAPKPTTRPAIRTPTPSPVRRGMRR